MDEIIDNRVLLSVFLSYSRKNSDSANEIADAIHAAGYRVLIDREDILPSENWKERLEKLINEADVVVFLLSPESLESDVCKWEVQHAAMRGKRLIPAVLEEPLNEEVPLFIQELNYLFLRSQSERYENLSRLVEIIGTDIKWFRNQTVLLQRALEWSEGGREKTDLLSGTRLENADDHLLKMPSEAPKSPTILIEYLDESRSFEKSERERASKREAAERLALEKRLKIAEANELAQQSLNSAILYPDRSAIEAVGAFSKYVTKFSLVALLKAATRHPRMQCYLRPIGILPNGAVEELQNQFSFSLDGDILTFIDLPDQRRALIVKSDGGSVCDVLHSPTGQRFTCICALDGKTVALGTSVGEVLLVVQSTDSKFTTEVHKVCDTPVQQICFSSDKLKLAVFSQSKLSIYSFPSFDKLGEISFSSNINAQAAWLNHGKKIVLTGPEVSVINTQDFTYATVDDILLFQVDAQSARAYGFRKSAPLHFVVLDFESNKILLEQEIIYQELRQVVNSKNPLLGKFCVDTSTGNLAYAKQGVVKFLSWEAMFDESRFGKRTLHEAEDIVSHTNFVHQIYPAKNCDEDFAFASHARDGSVVIWGKYGYPKLKTTMPGKLEFSSFEERAKLSCSPESKVVVRVGQSHSTRWDLDSNELEHDLSFSAHAWHGKEEVALIDGHLQVRTGGGWKIHDKNVRKGKIINSQEYFLSAGWGILNEAQLSVFSANNLYVDQEYDLSAEFTPEKFNDVSQEVFWDRCCGVDFIACGKKFAIGKNGILSWFNAKDDICFLKAGNESKVVLGTYSSIEVWDTNLEKQLWFWSSGSTAGNPMFASFSHDDCWLWAGVYGYPVVLLFDVLTGNLLHIVSDVLDDSNPGLFTISLPAKKLVFDNGEKGLGTFSVDPQDWFQRVQSLTNQESYLMF